MTDEEKIKAKAEAMISAANSMLVQRTNELFTAVGDVALLNAMVAELQKENADLKEQTAQKPKGK